MPIHAKLYVKIAYSVDGPQLSLYISVISCLFNSKFKLDLNLVVMINFSSVDCASRILNPVGAPARKNCIVCNNNVGSLSMCYFSPSIGSRLNGCCSCHIISTIFAVFRKKDTFVFLS